MMTAEQRRDLLEIMEDRHGRGSTVVTSQLSVERYPRRLVHNAHRLTLKGETAPKRQKLDDEPAN
jgi:hypothetical protein